MSSMTTSLVTSHDIPWLPLIVMQIISCDQCCICFLAQCCMTLYPRYWLLRSISGSSCSLRSTESCAYLGELLRTVIHYSHYMSSMTTSLVTSHDIPWLPLIVMQIISCDQCCICFLAQCCMTLYPRYWLLRSISGSSCSLRSTESCAYLGELLRTVIHYSHYMSSMITSLVTSHDIPWFNTSNSHANNLAWTYLCIYLIYLPIYVSPPFANLSNLSRCSYKRLKRIHYIPYPKP